MKDFLKYRYKNVDSVNNINNVSEEDDVISKLRLDDTDTLDSYDVDTCFDVADNIVAISNVDELAILIKTILELSWGKDWGELTPSYIEDEEHPIFPKIVYDINTRELSEFNSKKPIFFENVKEVVDGKETGDGFNIYRQWYDTVVEFNFYSTSIKEARTLMLEFEKVMNTYVGLLKKQGLSEIFYLEEIPSEKSLKYKPGVPMKSNAYYVRFESIYKVRTSLLKEIEYIINAR